MHPLILNVRECDVNGAAFSKRVLVGIPTLCGGHPRERGLRCLQNEEYKNDNRIRKKSKVSDAEQDLFEGCGAYRYRGRGCCVARGCHFGVRGGREKWISPSQERFTEGALRRVLSDASSGPNLNPCDFTKSIYTGKGNNMRVDEFIGGT